MSGQTRILGDREIQVYTDILGVSMLYVLWSDKQTLRSKLTFDSVEAAEAHAEILSSVPKLNMAHWHECFADEPDGWYPCGDIFSEWKARKDAEAS